MEGMWAGWGSALASFMFFFAMVRQYFSGALSDSFQLYASKLMALFYPYVEITIMEYSSERMKRSEAYSAVESYLSASHCARHARRLKADAADSEGSGSTVVLSIDESEEVVDYFAGAKLYWSSHIRRPATPSFSYFPSPPDQHFYRLSFHRRHRDLVGKSYLPHVLDQGAAAGFRNRRQRLYTNISYHDSDYRKRHWSHIRFEHPATFETIAMDPGKKREIVKDLIAFSCGKEFYSRIGKPWKRGYLLYGPPGTGKSTMIAAMANLLDYDIYDLELTAVKDNLALRRLLLEIGGKAIIVIEDIDCSLDLSGKRKEAKKPEEGEKKMGNEGEKEGSKVTLSGLLNFIDGLWSACGGERLVVFTTNFVEKLDPALIRSGRMDRHIHLSFCDFQGFKILARNYLDLEQHPLFAEIQTLLEERNITPADAAESLMPKKVAEAGEGPEVCLRSLIKALKESNFKLAACDKETVEVTTMLTKVAGEAEE